MSTSKQTAAEMVKLYFETKSPITATLIKKKKYPDDATLTKFQMHPFVIRFQQTGSVEDSRQENTGRPRSRRMDVKSQNGSQTEHVLQILLVELCTYFFINKIEFYVP